MLNRKGILINKYNYIKNLNKMEIIIEYLNNY